MVKYKTKKSFPLGSIIFVIVLALILIGAILMFCNTKNIADIKNSDYVGKTVKVKGIVENTIKIGSFSGYTLKDDTGTIGVVASSLPKEGDKTSVKGTLMKDTLLGYYIKAD